MQPIITGHDLAGSRARGACQGSEGGEPNYRPRKIVQKTKRLERLERAMEIRAFALELLGEQGRWTTLYPGAEVLRLAIAGAQRSPVLTRV